MKKIISLLLTMVIAFSAFATVGFANAQVFSMTVSTEEVEIGETFTVTVDVAKQRLSSWAANIKYDIEALEVVSFVDSKGNSYDYYYMDEDDNEYFSDFALYASNGTKALDGSADLDESRGVISFYGINSTSKSPAAKAGYAVITFKALKAGEVSLPLTEGYDYKQTVADGGENVIVDARVVQTASVTVKSAEPQLDETIAQGAKGDAAGNKVTWAGCSVGADLVAANKIKAVLTNSAAAAGDNTQEVALSFGDGISGGMACVFDVIVTFQDIANAATTSLEIVKAN